MVSIKCFIVLATLFLCGCQISGNYNYLKKDISEKHKNETVFSYSTKIKDYDFLVYNKINFDPIHRDRPPYYEASHEIWFW
jgi:hypothetical protein